MRTNRRHFMKAGAAGAAAVSFRQSFVWAFGQSPTGVSKFTEPLRGLGGTGIPVASPTVSIPGSYDLYELNILESIYSFHPDLGDTKIWGYTPKERSLLTWVA